MIARGSRPGALPALLAALAALAGLGPARADGPDERYSVRPAEVAGELRRQAVGIAIVAVAVGPGGEREIASFREEGEGEAEGKRAGFAPGPPLDLARTRPVNGWTYEGVAVGRYPVLERRAGHLRIALDPGGEATAWVRTTPRVAGVPSYPAVRDFDFGLDPPAGDLFDEPVADLFFFLEGSRRKLYARPEEGSPFRLIPGVQGEPGYEGGLVLGRRQGAFAEVLKLDLEAPPVALGWVKLRDGRGRLTVWLLSYDWC